MNTPTGSPESKENLSPQERLKNQLGENSPDYIDLCRLVSESNGKISWEKLEEYTKIEDRQVKGIYWDEDLDLKGTSITSLGKLKKVVNGDLKLEGVNTLKDLGELEEVGGDLDLMGTSITSLGKLKKVGRNLNVEGVKTLTDLGELQEVGFKLNLKGTSITSLGKLKKVGWYLDLEGVETLNDLGELEKVGGWYLDLRGTPLRTQLEAIKRINDGSLKVQGEVYFGGNIPGIEQILENEVIPGNLDLSGTSITSLNKLKKVNGYLDLEGVHTLKDLGELKYVGGKLNFKGSPLEIQLEAVKKIKNGILSVKKEVYYDEIIKSFSETDSIILLDYLNLGVETILPTGDFFEKVENFFGTPNDKNRNPEIIEISNEIGKIMINNYLTDFDKKVRELRETFDLEDISGLNKKLKALKNDFLQKRGFLVQIFGERLVNEMEKSFEIK